MTNKYTKFISNIQAKLSYAVAGAKLDFAADVQRLMDQQGLKRADLAERIGKSRPYVTKLLSGDANPTIETIVRTVHAMGGRIHIKIAGTDERLLYIRLSQAMFKQVQAHAEQAKRRQSVWDAVKIHSGTPMKLCANDDGYKETAVA